MGEQQQQRRLCVPFSVAELEALGEESMPTLLIWNDCTPNEKQHAVLYPGACIRETQIDILAIEDEEGYSLYFLVRRHASQEADRACFYGSDGERYYWCEDTRSKRDFVTDYAAALQWLDQMETHPEWFDWAGSACGPGTGEQMHYIKRIER